MPIEQMVSVPIQSGFGGNVKVIDIVPGRTRMLDVQNALLAEKPPNTIVVLSTAPAATGVIVALTSVAELLHHHESGVATKATYTYEEKRLAANTVFYTREEFLEYYGEECGMDRWEEAKRRTEHYHRQLHAAHFARTFLDRYEDNSRTGCSPTTSVVAELDSPTRYRSHLLDFI